MRIVKEVILYIIEKLLLLQTLNRDSSSTLKVNIL